MGRYDRKLLDLLARVNRLRLSGPSPELERLERRVTDGGASRRLAVYGTLVPGGANHRVIADLAGVWEPAFVRGTVDPSGWGRTSGFPAMRWSPDGEPIEVRMLTSPSLPSAWQRIDRFEGREYLRTLVPVDTAGGMVVANLYQLRPDAAGPGRDGTRR